MRADPVGGRSGSVVLFCLNFGISAQYQNFNKDETGWAQTSRRVVKRKGAIQMCVFVYTADQTGGACVVRKGRFSCDLI